ncbi:MAG: hypothetical protein JWO53_1306 [Chlamydiia bacterium]|nr:hypothetical protein [Chlamydiia bacterium]
MNISSYNSCTQLITAQDAELSRPRVANQTISSMGQETKTLEVARTVTIRFAEPQEEHKELPVSVYREITVEDTCLQRFQLLHLSLTGSREITEDGLQQLLQGLPDMSPTSEAAIQERLDAEQYELLRFQDATKEDDIYG